MNPPLRFHPPETGCSCPSLPDQLRATLEGIEHAPCKLHRPEAHARVQAAHIRAEAEFVRQALKDPEPEPAPHPLLDALTRKLPARQTMPLNASAEEMAAAIGLPGARTTDSTRPFDAPDN